MTTNPSTPNQATLGFLKVFFDALPQVKVHYNLKVKSKPAGV
jgi:hypothetical protein